MASNVTISSIDHTRWVFTHTNASSNQNLNGRFDGPHADQKVSRGE